MRLGTLEASRLVVRIEFRHPWSLFDSSREPESIEGFDSGRLGGLAMRPLRIPRADLVIAEGDAWGSLCALVTEAAQRTPQHVDSGNGYVTVADGLLTAAQLLENGGQTVIALLEILAPSRVRAREGPSGPRRCSVRLGRDGRTLE